MQLASQVFRESAENQCHAPLTATHLTEFGASTAKEQWLSPAVFWKPGSLTGTSTAQAAVLLAHAPLPGMLLNLHAGG